MIEFVIGRIFSVILLTIFLSEIFNRILNFFFWWISLRSFFGQFFNINYFWQKLFWQFSKIFLTVIILLDHFFLIFRQIFSIEFVWLFHRNFNFFFGKFFDSLFSEFFLAEILSLFLMGFFFWQVFLTENFEIFFFNKYSGINFFTTFFLAEFVLANSLYRIWLTLFNRNSHGQFF